MSKIWTKLRIASATLGLLAAAASAQDLSKFVLSDEAAKKTLNKYEINADTAEKIVKAAVDIATKDHMPITVFILSPTGQIVHSHRMDGQVPINIETALLKAQSVLYTRDSTHTRANMVQGNLALQTRWAPLGVFPTAGGLPIIVDGQMIGAIGVGGGRKDEQTAYEAVVSVVGPQPPLAPTMPPPAK